MTFKTDGNPWYDATNSELYFSPYDLMALNYLYGGDGLNGQKGLVYGLAPASLAATLDSDQAYGVTLDDDSYMQAKLAQMQSTDSTYTSERLAQAFTDAGFQDAASHYLAHGQYEGISLSGVQQDDIIVLMAEYIAA